MIIAHLSRLVLCFGLGLVLTACQFTPLHGNSSLKSSPETQFAFVDVASVDTRVGQQVRNHLLFLLNGNSSVVDKTHEVKLRIKTDNRELARIEGTRDNVSGTITVSVSYNLIDLKTGESIKTGNRQAEAFYDRTGQVFANNRAIRDAENRAAKEAAEFIRLAIASDLANT